MSTTARLMTAEEFLRRPDDGLWHELVRGVLTTMPLPGGRHGTIAMRLGRWIGNHVEAHGLGETFAAETGFLIGRDPDTVRGADVAIVRTERLGQITDPDKHVPFAPDLVVEVISPHDRPGDVAEKTREWLAAGVPMVWNVFDKSKSVAVHRPGVEPLRFSDQDWLDGGEVVPGFRCRVGDIFA